jgi:hypothetical protein
MPEDHAQPGQAVGEAQRALSRSLIVVVQAARTEMASV